jgi:hypothetical protein
MTLKKSEVNTNVTQIPWRQVTTVRYEQFSTFETYILECAFLVDADTLIILYMVPYSLFKAVLLSIHILLVLYMIHYLPLNCSLHYSLPIATMNEQIIPIFLK